MSEYKKLTEQDLAEVAKIVPRERILWADEINEEYSHDELTATPSYPDLVVRATSAEEISGVLKYANKEHIAVTPRGAGTGLVGASVAVEHGIMIDTTLMNHFLELDEENLTLIYQYVEPKGLFYPPDPGEKTATIGGNISTNAGGMRAVKYGVTRDFVRGLEIVLADGTIMEVGGKVVKNSSGYDLKDMIIGSEGTLAFVTKAILKLLPLPQKAVSLLVPFPTLAQAIRTVPLIVKSKATPTAIEFMEREVIMDAENFLGQSFPDNQADAYLLLKFDGSNAEDIAKDYDAVAQLCLEQGAIDVLIADTDERADAIWKTRGSFLQAISGSTTMMDEVDVVVPRNKVNEFVEYVHALQDEMHVRIKSFGHAGDGNLHVYILRDDLDEEAWEKVLNDTMEKMYAKARTMDGKVSGEHGIGFAKKPYLKEDLDPAAVEIMRGIKKAFDPNNILNPRKVCFD